MRFSTVDGAVLMLFAQVIGGDMAASSVVHLSLRDILFLCQEWRLARPSWTGQTRPDYDMVKIT
jgi:hypothetical protein